MINIIVLFVSIIFFSALCSMSEAALLSLPFVRARILKEQNKKHSTDLLFIKENISDTVAAIVIANNIINIVGSIYVGHLVTTQFGSHWLGFASTVLTFSIIIASEIIPKTIGERHKISISLLLAKPLRYLLLCLRPFIRVIMKFAKPFVKHKIAPKVTEEEIKMMLKLGRVEGTVEVDEEVLCNRVFKLNDVRAVQIMKPIKQIFALPVDKNLRELKDQIIQSKFSRIAVYDSDLLNIVGTVQQRILLREIAKDNYDASIKDFMVEPIFVNWFTKADALLEKFQQSHQHLFIVVDSQEKVVGLVTMEDVLEELFGEIYDEKDVVKPEFEDTTKMDANSISLDLSKVKNNNSVL